MELREECGIFGVWGHRDASNVTRLGLFALQHRGQESAGIVSSQGGAFHMRRGMGLVEDVFPDHPGDSLPGRQAVGHVRYSTTGASLPINMQPFVVKYARGSLAVAQ